MTGHDSARGEGGEAALPFTPLFPRALARVFRRGQVVVLPYEAAAQVLEGVVSRVAIHADGAEVLLGLFGPGELLVPHPDDRCHISTVAQTNVVVAGGGWRDVDDPEAVMLALQSQFRRMEAWTAMQAHPYVDRRVQGLLELLAERFGKPHPQGALIDLRITHHQLAAAAGCTRASVTRLIGKLRAAGVLTVVGAHGSQRFCLVGVEPAAARH